MKDKLNHNVRPRYTCGSPAAVTQFVAETVAQEEKRGYERALTGIFGEEELVKAKSLGLRGIVEKVLGEKKAHGSPGEKKVPGLMVYDLLTGETYWRPLRSGSGMQKEPDPGIRHDHHIDEDTIRFVTADAGADYVRIAGECVKCGATGSSEPIQLHFEDEECEG